MSEMPNQNSENNGVNRHPTTVRTKWSKNVNKLVMDKK